MGGEKPDFGYAYPHSMLHQTLPTFPSMQSFCFSSSPSLPPFSPPLVKREMEACVGTSALKPSFLPEMNAKSAGEEAWLENMVAGDEFFVDDLLDFSKEEVFNEEANDFVSVEEKKSDNVDGVEVTDVFTELSVPADESELEQLEWLSQFVEDSEQSHQYPEQKPNPNPVVKFQNPKQSNPETSENLIKTGILRTPFPGKPRSKRTRRGVQVWSSLGSSSSLTESSISTSSSSSSSGSGSSVSNPCLVFTPTTYRNFDIFRNFEAPAAKKPKKRHEAAAAAAAPAQQRRCSHCGVQKTPQWRQGPEGAKTLCNACGVRYKSGRLLPEYRPACSPTFSSEVHSNSHRKVLEMRMKKVSGTGTGTGTGSGRADSALGRPVQSF